MKVTVIITSLLLFFFLGCEDNPASLEKTDGNFKDSSENIVDSSGNSDDKEEVNIEDAILGKWILHQIIGESNWTTSYVTQDGEDTLDNGVTVPKYKTVFEGDFVEVDSLIDVVKSEILNLQEKQNFSLYDNLFKSNHYYLYKGSYTVEEKDLSINFLTTIKSDNKTDIYENDTIINYKVDIENGLLVIEYHDIYEDGKFYSKGKKYYKPYTDVILPISWTTTPDTIANDITPEFVDKKELVGTWSTVRQDTYDLVYITYNEEYTFMASGKYKFSSKATEATSDDPQYTNEDFEEFLANEFRTEKGTWRITSTSLVLNSDTLQDSWNDQYYQYLLVEDTFTIYKKQNKTYNYIRQ